MLWLYLKQGEPGVSLNSRTVLCEAAFGAFGSKESSASARYSLGTGFLRRLSILLFSGLILICMLQAWHVQI